ncbi:MAG: TetR family transcriptional regulator [Pseudonocardia sp.]|uniref:TetR family transcriptional regulator n=1 Tax=unclassified Pseudonocardia TaxID=2619320 RepID=UPI00086CFC22|nr:MULTISPECIES: TetR family transcriptional regulator [unclassified Pseudonocardia]MBN9107410.1 TetR family transcriptional regulator [Pseudonocardia sp.]ODU26628.1 MAG: transcriptional regulator [Pseudonocardia sp. SCN 72-51]ODV08282.1 MAG: transcriptional regulator [Pseudonocardia sp. SCN 73-27]
MVASGARVGGLVRAARQGRGVGLRELAARIGVSPATLSEIEHGRTRLTVDRLGLIAAALDMPVGDVLDGRTPRAAEASSEPGRDATDWRRYDPLDLDPVLDAARAEFLAVGYHGATMRRIAARCGLSVSGLYHHYAGKQQILLALVEVTMADLGRRSDAARAEGRDPVDRFCLLVENLALYHSHRAELAFVGNTEMRSFTEANRRRVAGLRTRQQRMVDTEVDAAVAAGAFRPDHPHEASRAVVTMCTALTDWYRPGGPSTPEQIARRYVGFALDMLEDVRAAG